MTLPSALGVVGIHMHDGRTHQWATGARLAERDGRLVLEWFEDQHHHLCFVVGPPRVVGEELHLDTDPHGPVVIRALGPQDTWPLYPGNLTAWEAYQQGLV